MDTHAHLRHIGFTTLAGALGIDLAPFKRSKDEWVGPCPYHKPKNNKQCFRYKDDGLFNCFVCLKAFCGRGPIDFYKAYASAGFQQAVAFLTPLATSPAPQQKSAPERVSEAIESPIELKPFTGKYHLHFIENEWLTARCPDAAVRNAYGVGFYSNPARSSKYNNRVFIPIKDLEGTQYGWLVRTPNPQPQEPKYVWPAGQPKAPFLFGADVLKAGRFGPLPIRVCYLVESPFCVMKFASVGLPAVSPFGWSVSEEQITLIQDVARGIVLLPDANKQQESADTAHRLSRRLWVRFPQLPDGCEDPEHLDREAILALTR